MPISGYVGAGAQEGLDQVLQRRLQEMTRRAVEEQRQQELQLRREAMDLDREQAAALASERAADRAHQQGQVERGDALALSQLLEPGTEIDEAQRGTLGKHPATAGLAVPRKIIDARPIPGTAPLDTSGPQTLPGRFDYAGTPEQQTAQRKTINLQRLGDRLAGATDEGQRRSVGAQAFGQGLDVPNNLLGQTGTEKTAQELEAEQRGNREWDRRQGITENALRERAALDDARTEKAKAGKGTGTLSYARELNGRVTTAANLLAGRVSPWTTGRGSLLSFLPETAAADFEADLNFLKANIAFGALAAMRAASPTGGALGAVSERELALLESTLGALSTKQSPANFKRNLQQIVDSIDRWNKASTQGPQSPFEDNGSESDDADMQELLRRRDAQRSKK